MYISDRTYVYRRVPYIDLCSTGQLRNAAAQWQGLSSRLVLDDISMINATTRERHNLHTRFDTWVLKRVSTLRNRWWTQPQNSIEASNQGINGYFPFRGTYGTWGFIKCIAWGHYCRCQKIWHWGPHSEKSVVFSTEPQQVLKSSTMYPWMNCKSFVYSWHKLNG